MMWKVVNCFIFLLDKKVKNKKIIEIGFGFGLGFDGEFGLGEVELEVGFGLGDVLFIKLIFYKIDGLGID